MQLVHTEVITVADHVLIAAGGMGSFTDRR
jgi:hypothetical protein